MVCGENAEARRGVAVDDQAGLQAAVLLVAGHVAQLRQRAAACPPAAAPTRQLVGVGVFEVYWYCVRLTRSSTVRSCTGCM